MSNPMTTYRRADGELIAGKYGWVGELEWFEMFDDPTEYIEEVWTLQSSRSFMVPFLVHYGLNE